MGLKIISREDKQKRLQEFYGSNRPEFMPIYDRRRVGKTFLIKQYFEKKKCFFFNTNELISGVVKLDDLF